jgi:subfamily B ATP-binding cassette protein MsbA
MALFFRRIWTIARPYRARLFLGFFCGVVYALSNGALMFLVKWVVNLVFPGSGHFNLTEQLDKAPALLRPITHLLGSWLSNIHATSHSDQVFLISLLPALALVRVLSGYLNVYFANWAAVRAIADLRAQLFNHIQNLPLSFFGTARTGEITGRILNDTGVLHGIIANSMSALVKDPLTVLTLLFVLLGQPETRKLTLISCAALIVCLVPMKIYASKVRKSAKAMQTHVAELNSVMHETFTGNRIVKAYNLEETMLAKFREATRKYVGQMMRIVRANEIPSQLTEFAGVVGVALVLLYAIFQTNPATPGDFVSFILAIVVMYQPIKSLVKLQNQLHQADSASQKIFELLDLQSSIPDPVNPVPLKTAKADIEFKDVEFAYDEKQPVLRDINLKVKAGQMVALVGGNGSGKTSLTNLLLRFYDPQRGAVLIDGTDIRQVAVKDLRNQIAFVSQGTILFHDTIRNNIALGRPGATDAEIEAAAKNACADEFILERPERYQTMVGEKGISLSGGQRQRISIARAILRDAPILVLDEATSEFDSESERTLQVSLEELMEGRTTICIAHRLSTVQKADLIVVLENGRIVETGTHAQLLQARGVYWKLYKLYFESDDPVPR